LEESNALAEQNRGRLLSADVFAVNIMSSPGAGKTTLLQQTIGRLQAQGKRCGVIEGDITTTLDSERLAPLGVPIVQVNTQPFGGNCHVGAHLVEAALRHFDLHALDYLFIENIGNLVCPAEFDLGEHRKVVVLSLPEGEDKPLKYPLMFRECHLCLLNKMDLLPHLDVDVRNLTANIRQINGQLPVLPISAKTGDGLEAWIGWLLANRD
jgi:hydrogenase nickel incorporation protein HypB